MRKNQLSLISHILTDRMQVPENQLQQLRPYQARVQKSLEKIDVPGRVETLQKKQGSLCHDHLILSSRLESFCFHDNQFSIVLYFYIYPPTRARLIPLELMCQSIMLSFTHHKQKIMQQPTDWFSFLWKQNRVSLFLRFRLVNAMYGKCTMYMSIVGASYIPSTQSR